MKRSFRYLDPLAYKMLAETMACNRDFFRLLASYLNNSPCLVTATMIKELTASCHVQESEAFCAILSAAFGWEEEKRERDNLLFHKYLQPSVRSLDAAYYRTDPYYAHIHIPDRVVGKWHVKMASYAPYEGFICGPLSVDDRLTEVPPVGYFAEEFFYPMVLENGVEWMAIKPNEVETMRHPLSMAHGRVLTYGLGLGYFAYMASRNPLVESVTVVERDGDVIRLFCEELLPQFSHKEKIRLVQADAFTFAESAAARGFDHVFVDIWHDAGDGLPLYLRMRRVENAHHDVPYEYWIEDMILSRLRSMVYAGISGENSLRINSVRDVYEMLSNSYLRRLAPDLRAISEE